eukprot:scaffold49454_cov16-Tisochrysis_lutea.AAC.1
MPPHIASWQQLLPEGICASMCEQPAILAAEQQAKDLFPESVICNNPDGSQGECGEGSRIPCMSMCFGV